VVQSSSVAAAAESGGKTIAEPKLPHKRGEVHDRACHVRGVIGRSTLRQTRSHPGAGGTGAAPRVPGGASPFNIAGWKVTLRVRARYQLAGVRAL